MTGHGFFSSNSNSGALVSSSKSGSLPGRGSSGRGFRDTFISSMSNASGSMASSSSPQHGVRGLNENGGGGSVKENGNGTPRNGGSGGSGKKWSFGGLFKRKVKNSVTSNESQSPSVSFVGSSPMSVSPSPYSPAPSSVPSARKDRHHHKPSESDLSNSDFEESGRNHFSTTTPRPPQLSFKHNFLARKLSKRKEKASKKSDVSAQNGFLKVPGQLHNGRRVGSSPDSLNNSVPVWPSWETTKKCPPSTANYSSSGSLSLSLEGGSSKSSRAAVKEAVKARAVARRESYLHESSSSDEDTEERSRSSLQGSHSSLSSRNRRPHNQRHNAVLNNHVQIRSVNDHTPSPFVVQSSRNDKSVHNGSPARWEARIIYSQDNMDVNPGDVQLRKNGAMSQDNFIMTTEMNSDDQPVITAGLRVPLAPNGTHKANYAQQPQQVTYANLQGLPNGNGIRSSTPYNYYSVSPSPPPPPPPRDFSRAQMIAMRNSNQVNGTSPNFYRPVSCSYLDSYHPTQTIPSPYENGRNSSHHQGYVTPSNVNDMNRYYIQSVGLQQRAYSPRNNNIMSQSPYYNQSPLVRSPSEPPEMKVERIQRNSPLKRASPYDNNQSYEMNGNNSGILNGHEHAMSKLGYPVRRLHESGRLPPTQSPVHTRASEFWRRREQETVETGNGTNGTRKPFLCRVRSADSSPLPVPRMRNSPAAALLNSNESISSLSSYSAEAHSPNMLNQSKNGKTHSGPLRPHTLTLKNSSGFQLKGVNKSQPQPSACERLGIKAQSAGTEDKGGKVYLGDSSNKTPGKNLEDALNELEDMYKSLRLSDEDLLDRAERRDLPTPHQELRNITLPPLSPPPCGSIESLATGTGSSSGSTNPFMYSTENLNRQRAPPMRRSSRPDPVADDMANRRFDHPDKLPNDPRDVVSKTGSYMILSPAFSPPTSPCPQDSASLYLGGHDDPDLTLDDLSFRNYQRANALRIIEPQPKFGIPLGPVTPAPASDYLHSNPVEKFRPLFRHMKRPDVVKDDIAFRNLRKDLNQDNNLSKDWTPRLFSPTRDNVFTFNMLEPSQRSRKLRAIRSLSANISQMIPFHSSPVNFEIGKWNSFTDLNRSASPSSSTRMYRQPSWVEQVEKVQTSTETITELGLLGADGQLLPKFPKKVVSIPPSDPSSPRRPWTDILLESFQKEREDELERQAAVLSQAQVTEELAAAQPQDQAFQDDAKEKTSPEERVNATPSTVIMPTSSHLTSSYLPSTPFSLLEGQKTRRGSWVESKSTQLFMDNVEEEMRRRSWSDLPKEVLFPSELYASSNLFNPLPPPRKVKEINLEAFNRKSSCDPEKDQVSSDKSDEGETNVAKKTYCRSTRVLPTTTAHASSPSPTNSNRGEDELNELMDALLREADTCGPPSTRRRVPKDKRKHWGDKRSDSETYHAQNCRENVTPPPKIIAEERKVTYSPSPPATDSEIETSTVLPDRVTVTQSNTLEPPPGPVIKGNSIEDIIECINEKIPEMEATYGPRDGKPETNKVAIVEVEIKKAIVIKPEAETAALETSIPIAPRASPRKKVLTEPEAHTISDENENMTNDTSKQPFPRSNATKDVKSQVNDDPPVASRRHQNNNKSAVVTPSSTTYSSGSPKSPEGELDFESEGWLDRWSRVLLIACYLLAFTYSMANIELVPAFGIFLAVLVFFAHLLL